MKSSLSQKPQKINHPKQRYQSRLEAQLDKNLRAYEVAASTGISTHHGLSAAATIAAVGLGVIALPQLADARVVFTPANQSLHGPINRFPVDFNNDGINDASIYVLTSLNIGSSCGEWNNSVYAEASQPGNGIAINQKKFAAAGRLGQILGGFDAFEPSPLMAGYHRVQCGHTSGVTRVEGPWRNVNRFLGVKFSISGETHYGWLRIKMDSTANAGYLTGYAYETIPNKPIKAGFDDNGLPIPEPLFGPASISLGSLAAGARQH